MAAAAAKGNVHPFDFTKLRKGMWIDAKELERATFRKRSDPVYLRAVLKMRDLIEKETGILGRIEGDRLRLMTDAEALAWSMRQAKLAGDRMERASEHLKHNIDRNNLTQPERVVHEHAERVITAMADAQRTQRQKHARLFEFISAHRELGEGDED